MIDQFGREIDYLRISVTDRCNLRCVYCMPQEGIPLYEHKDALTYEEIVTICRCVCRLGIRKIKLTGGEPLVRKGLTELVRKIKEIPNIEEVTLTTNGILLGDMLEELKEAGLDGINISIDTLNADKFRKITRMGELDKVLAALKKACTMGFQSIKVNSLIMEEMNRSEVVHLASLAKEYPVSVRFIEMMPIGSGEGFHPVYQEALMEDLQKVYGELSPFDKVIGNGPARYFELPEFQGKIGFISAVSHEFCKGCNRIRLTCDGNLKLCLQYKNVLNIKELLRRGTKEDQLTEIIRMAIFLKPENHDFNGTCSNGRNYSQESNPLINKIEKETKNMAQIGG